MLINLQYLEDDVRQLVLLYFLHKFPRRLLGSIPVPFVDLDFFKSDLLGKVPDVFSGPLWVLLVLIFQNLKLLLRFHTTVVERISILVLSNVKYEKVCSNLRLLVDSLVNFIFFRS